MRSGFQRTCMSLNSNVAVMRPHIMGATAGGIGAGRNTSSHARAPLHQALLVGVGLAILANSRPYEGLIFSCRRVFFVGLDAGETGPGADGVHPTNWIAYTLSALRRGSCNAILQSSRDGQCLPHALSSPRGNLRDGSGLSVAISSSGASLSP